LVRRSAKLVSDFFLVSAVTNSDGGKKEISLFIVDKGPPGFRLGKDQAMMGVRGTSRLELWFDNVVLGPECLLGERGLGFKMAMEVHGCVHLAQVAARAVGKSAHVPRTDDRLRRAAQAVRQAYRGLPAHPADAG
jgi:acyl-CoA dehydrogenase